MKNTINNQNQLKVVSRIARPSTKLTKNRAYITKVYTFKYWFEQLYVRIDDVESDMKQISKLCNRRYKFKGDTYHILNLENEQQNSKNSSLTWFDIKHRYSKYVDLSSYHIMVESKYILIKYGYEATTNTWDEVDSLGVTRHFESDDINSIFLSAESVNQARYLAKFELGVDYTEIKVRRNSSYDIYILSNPHEHFPVIAKLTHEQIYHMFECLGNKIGSTRTNYGVNNLVKNKFTERICKPLVANSIMFIKNKSHVIGDSNINLEHYCLTTFGKELVNILIGTKNRIQHYKSLTYLKSTDGTI